MKEGMFLCVLLIVSTLMTAPAQINQVKEENFALTLLTFSSNDINYGMVDLIRQYLSPLNIKVNVKIEPFANYRDIIYNPEDNSWDLALVYWEFPDDQGYPDIAELYSNALGESGRAWIPTDWEQIAYDDTGINVTEFDILLEDLKSGENTIEEKVRLSNTISELFMSRLLTKLPLSQRTTTNFFANDIAFPETIIQQGFPSLSNFYNLAEALFTGLQKDESILRLFDSDFINPPYSLDPFRYQAQIKSRLMNSELTTRFENNTADSLVQFHPGLATQFIIEDYTNTTSGNIVKNGKVTFRIRQDAYWKQVYTNGSKNVLTDERISPEDFAFALQLAQDKVIQRMGFFKGLSPSILPYYEFDENESTFTVFFAEGKSYENVKKLPSNRFIQAIWNLAPIPEFVFNTTLNFGGISGTPEELGTYGIPVFLTDEYVEYQRNPLISGPYEIVEYIPGTNTTLQLRDDYWFPNEWDSPNGQFTNIYDKPLSPVYFTWNATEDAPQQKPTTLPVSEIVFTEPNLSKFPTIFQAVYDLFVNDQIDSIHFVPNDQNAYPFYQSLVENYQTFVEEYSDVGTLLLLNLKENLHLQQYNVRKAIYTAINRTELTGSYSFASLEWNSIIPRHFRDLYTTDYDIPYDYSVARDLMRSTVNPITGKYYTALKTNEFPNIDPIPDLREQLTSTKMQTDFYGLNLVILVIGLTALTRKNLGEPRLK